MEKKQSKKITITRQELEKRLRRKRHKGIRLAANITSAYNGSTTHTYRLDDCILGKTNLLPKDKIRKNKDRIAIETLSDFIKDMKSSLNRYEPRDSKGFRRPKSGKGS